MYEQTRADVVVVAVNELSMATIATNCFEYPWTCLLEKPVGIDVGQAEEILAASLSAHARCYVALNRRNYGSTRRALEELHLDASPRLIDVLDQQDMAGARALGQPDLVVQNYMYANSIHLIDYMYIFGRGNATRVDHIRPWNPEEPGFVAAAVHFDSGDTAVYQAVWDGPGPWAVSVTARELRLELRPLERLGIQRRDERRLTEVAQDQDDVEFKPGLRHQAALVLASLQGDVTGLASLADATRSMRLCATLYGMRGGLDCREG
jgi:predicted dehydrogenase